MIRFAMAETIMEARRLAREAVRQRLKERGQKVSEFSFKQIVELGDDLLRSRPELIDLRSGFSSSSLTLHLVGSGITISAPGYLR